MTQEKDSIDIDAECDSLEASYSPYTILVAEDDKEVRGNISRRLQALGFHVIEARDGVDALIAAAPIDIDLLLTDIEMPHMNGFDLAAKLIKHRPATKVLFLDEFEKVNLEMLLTRIRDALARKERRISGRLGSEQETH
jgi:CheY-like chemotaxis protein